MHYNSKQKKVYIIFSLINLFLFVILALFVKQFPVVSLDISVSQFIQSFESPALTHFMKFISFWGYPAVGLSLVFALSLYSHFQKKHHLKLFFISVFVGDLISGLTKYIVSRPRPTSFYVHQLVHLTDYSFPSFHVVHYVLLFGLVLHFSKNLFWRLICTSSILLVGISRIYLGAHWYTDVLGGYLFSSGFLALILVLSTNRRWPRLSGNIPMV